MKTPRSAMISLTWILTLGWILMISAGSESWGRTARRGVLTPRAADALWRLEQRVGRAPLTVRRAGGGGVARISWGGGLNLAVTGGSADERARAFLAAHGEVLGLETGDGLALARLETWAGGEVARYRVLVDGLPMLGHSVTVRLRGARVAAAAGGLPPVRTIASGCPALDPAAIARAVEIRTGAGLHRVQELGYVVRGDAAILAWRAVQYRGPTAQRWILVVDATTGEVLSAGPGQQGANGYVYNPSPAVAGVYESVTLPYLTSTTGLAGTYAAAHQCVGPHGEGTAAPPCSQHQPGASPDAAGDYLLLPVEPSLTDGFAAVQAYYHVTRFNRWIEDRFGFAWQCAGSRQVDVFVNWSYGNAFYGDGDGDGCPDLTLGEQGLDFAYDADVIYHEMGHGLVSQTAALGCEAVGVCLDSLGVNWIPSGLSEGLADYFSMTYTGSPDLGEHVAQLYGDAYLRTAENDAVCPWDLMSQAHHDGHILMGGVWDLRKALGTDRADDLVYGALLGLPEDAEYAELAAALEQAAVELQGAGLLTAAGLATVRQVIGPAGRNMAGCDRIVPLDHRPADRPTQLVYGYPTLPGTLDELPLGLQLTLDAPAGAETLTVTIAPQYGLGAAWRVYLRRDQPVHVDLWADGVDVTADHVFSGSPNAVQLRADGAPALRPGSVYYVAVVYSAPDSELFELAGRVTVDPTEPQDASVPDSGPAADAAVPPDGYQPDSLTERPGCDCQSPGPGSAPGGALPLLLGLALLLLRRRRR